MRIRIAFSRVTCLGTSAQSHYMIRHVRRPNWRIMIYTLEWCACTHPTYFFFSVLVPTSSSIFSLCLVGRCRFHWLRMINEKPNDDKTSLANDEMILHMRTHANATTHDYVKTDKHTHSLTHSLATQRRRRIVCTKERYKTTPKLNKRKLNKSNLFWLAITHSVSLSLMLFWHRQCNNQTHCCGDCRWMCARARTTSATSTQAQRPVALSPFVSLTGPCSPHQRDGNCKDLHFTLSVLTRWLNCVNISLSVWTISGASPLRHFSIIFIHRERKDCVRMLLCVANWQRGESERKRYEKWLVRREKS